jgi:dTMP kinase
MRGILIAFEGKDKCGKTTQAKMLVNKLNRNNIKTEYLAFPNRNTYIGKKIDKYLKKEIYYTPDIIEILFAENRKEMQEYILSNLKNNINVVLDRYYISGIVYSKAHDNKVNFNLNKGLVKPDITILLDYVYGELKNEEKYENNLFQSKLNFYEFKENDWLVFKDNYPKEVLNNKIIDLIEPFLNSNKEIKYVL